MANQYTQDQANAILANEAKARRFVPTAAHTCSVCGGAAMRRTNVAAPYGTEDTAYPLLHLHQADWVDDPHEVTED